jgi:hypothetical protein
VHLPSGYICASNPATLRTPPACLDVVGFTEGAQRATTKQCPAHCSPPHLRR